MGRGKVSPHQHPSIIFSLLALGVLILLETKGARGKEFRRESTCYSDTLSLDCGKHSFLAIHEAFFTTETNQSTCRPPALEHEYIDEDASTESANSSFCYEDIRLSINRRCSGNKNCNYSYSQVSDRICSNPEGQFVVRFDCVRESNLNKYCSTKVQSREGYIMSPGYPQYYPKLSECSWALTALEGQSILAKVLHLHLRDAVTPRPTPPDPDSYYPYGVLLPSEQITRCDDDRLTVVEGISNKHFDVCGESLSALRNVEVDGSIGLEVRFRSAGFMPASGFLLYFKIHGCATLPAKEGSHLVERNGSLATYACEKNRVFNDTLENTRILQCVRDRYWNDTVPPCTTSEETTTTMNLVSMSNLTTSEDFSNGTSSGIFGDFSFSNVVDKNADLWADVIIPCIIVIGLLIGNVFILIAIFVIRKRNKPSPDEFDIAKSYQPGKEGEEEEA